MHQRGRERLDRERAVLDRWVGWQVVDGGVGNGMLSVIADDEEYAVALPVLWVDDEVEMVAYSFVAVKTGCLHGSTVPGTQASATVIHRPSPHYSRLWITPRQPLSEALDHAGCRRPKSASPGHLGRRESKT